MGNDGHPVGSITKRLVYSLVLLPIVPSVTGIGMTVWGEYGPAFLGPVPFDEVRCLNLLFSLFWVAATIVIWRAVILWTLGRRWLTVLVGLIPFVQTVHAQPFWRIGGCLGSISEGFLRVGQNDVGIGVWVWLSIWVWWGWEKSQMNQTEKVSTVVPRMSSTAKRVVASIGSIPVIFGLWVIIIVYLDDVLGFRDPLGPAYALSACAAVVIWILIWEHNVAWSAMVARTTLTLTLLLAIPIALCWAHYDRVTGDTLKATLGVLPLIGWGVWMAATVTTWPMRSSVTPGEDTLMPRCLSCNYPLVGLRATRCPECGSEPTLDALWRASVGDL